MIIDCAQDVTAKLPALKAAGVTAIIRYISQGNPRKCITEREALAISAAGMWLGLVYEDFGGSENFRHHDINSISGASHALFCNNFLAQHFKMAGGIACVYFAVDTDCSPVQFETRVKPYFTAIQNTHKNYSVGVYGCGYVGVNLLNGHLAEKAWLANATGWREYREFLASNRWSIVQHLPRHVTGLDVDTDNLQASAHSNSEIDAGFIRYAEGNAP